MFIGIKFKFFKMKIILPSLEKFKDISVQGEEQLPKIQQRLLNLLKQILFDFVLVKNNSALERLIESYSTHSASYLLKNITHPNYYAQIIFCLGMLSHENNAHSKKMLNKATEMLFKILLSSNKEEKIRTVVCWDTEKEEFFIYEPMEED